MCVKTVPLLNTLLQYNIIGILGINCERINNTKLVKPVWSGPWSIFF